MTTQMQQLLNRNNEELYKRIEGLEHQMNPNAGRPYGRNRRVNNGPNQIEGQDKIEGVKLNVPPFKGRSDPDAYLDWEMKIQHAFSYNDYPKEQKVKLAAATFSGYALVWWKKNQREMKREEGWEIDTWTEMRRVMQERYVPTSYSRTMRQKPQSIEPLLHEFKDAFPNEIPHGLPLSRGIEHQVDLLSGASLPNRPGYKSNPQETQHKDAHAKVEYVKRLYDQVKVQFAKKNESYAKQANKIRKEEVLEPGDDPGHLRENVVQEGGNDENLKTAQIQGPMTRSKAKQSIDTLQQMVADILSKA
ncbi:hypothetical protein GmHk_20G057526 [Glycine max]|nr:hypothetical protein GmHk_20G057526 [Glycine max]